MNFNIDWKFLLGDVKNAQGVNYCGRASGRASFEIDVTEFVNEGKNLIAARPDNGLTVNGKKIKLEAENQGSDGRALAAEVAK